MLSARMLTLIRRAIIPEASRNASILRRRKGVTPVHFIASMLMIVVLEGLEGCGKTTLGQQLSLSYGFTYVKVPPNEYNSVRAYIAGNSEPYAAFYFYVSSLFAVQGLLRPFSQHPTTHVIVDRYVHSTIAYHTLGRSFLHPCFEQKALINSDLTINVTCDDLVLFARREKRGFHIFERSDTNDGPIKTYFNGHCDAEFVNSEDIESSSRKLAELIGKWFLKNKQSL